ncbi:hypothetical protein B7994_02160 [Fibrobacter sp. UWR2]|nr:hypothetical protein B7994_02160 [Fibrobacter sp. UWR2]
MGIVALLSFACTRDVAGTTEETNALAHDESSSSLGGKSSSSYSELPSSSGSVGISSGVSDSSQVPSDSLNDNVLNGRYWNTFRKEDGVSDLVSVNMEVDEQEGVYVSYALAGSPYGGVVGASRKTTFGVSIKVDGSEENAYSDMKTWTSGACYMVTSDAPIILKMGMSPEKERELEYDLPQATLVGPGEVGNLVLRCLSWLDFEQQGFGPSITIEEAFFDYMTELRFELQIEGDNFEGSFKISQIRRGGTGISADVDGTEVHLNDGE